MTKRVWMAVALALASAAASGAQAAVPVEETGEAPPQVVERFKALYPNTVFRKIRKARIAGLYELTMGENTAFADESGRYFVFGHLFDMQEQVDLTARSQAEAKRVEFPGRFLSNAIKTVKGDGRRIVALFSDPDCPHCRRLDSELAQLGNVTIYTFLYPLAALHPQATAKAVSIWCAPDRVQAWGKAIAGSTISLAPAACVNPINDNLALGARLGVAGTPTLIAQDGRMLAGAASAERIEQWLGAVPTTQARIEGSKAK